MCPSKFGVRARHILLLFLFLLLTYVTYLRLSLSALKRLCVVLRGPMLIGHSEDLSAAIAAADAEEAEKERCVRVYD